MTLRAWLRGRSPIPPPRLTARIEEVLRDCWDCDAGEASERCVVAAAQLLQHLLTRPSTGRESALDLLTVDALVTYAFEAAAIDPTTLPRRADAAMAHLIAAAQ